MLGGLSVTLWRLTEAASTDQESRVKGLPSQPVSSPHSQDFQRGQPELLELQGCVVMIAKY